MTLQKSSDVQTASRLKRCIKIASGALVTAASVLAVYAQPGGEKALVAGIVRNSATRMPVRNTRVTLRALESAAAGQTASSAATDNEGKFVLDDLPAGRYQLAVMRAGYLPWIYRIRGSAAIAIGAGQRITGLTVDLEPYSVISGTVVDENGEPLTQVRVSAMRRSRSNGHIAFDSGNTLESVDDKGNFRLPNLRPGRYIVCADPPLAFRENAGAEQYIRTCYPSARARSEAELVVLPPGSESNITIRLRKERVFRVQGKIVDEETAARPSNRFLIALRPTRALRPEFVFSDSARTGVSAGQFSFDQVLPGSYTIEADTMTVVFRTERMEANVFGRFPVTINDQSISGLVVPFRPGAKIEGAIMMETGDASNPQTPLKAQPILLLRSESNSSGDFDYSLNVNGDGHFDLTGLAPQRYLVDLADLPEGHYLKSVSFGDDYAAGGAIDLSNGVGGTLRILVSPNGAEVSGVVRNKDGEAIVDATVTLAPTEIRNLPSLFRQAHTDANGQFKIAGLRPGEYRVLAWEDVDTKLATDPEFCAAFSEQARTVKVEEGSKASLDLKLIPRAASLAEQLK